jgi:CO/xanthine dehydrogenase FAD-binding subunit
MKFLQPASLADALAAKAECPGAVPIAGGTDVMVEINFDVRRPEALLDLNRVPELTSWSADGGIVRLGAGVTYARLTTEQRSPGGRPPLSPPLGDLLPGLAMAARTVGSPQIRNRGTIGGNLGAASPAGDCHPVLLAAGAAVEAASVRGSRLIPAGEFFLGPKRHALAPDELITAVLVPAARGPQQFAKIGTRNAMVIAVCAFALELRPPRRSRPDIPNADSSGADSSGAGSSGTNIPDTNNSGVDIADGDVLDTDNSDSDIARVGYPGIGTGIGSAGPVPLRAPAAEEFLGGVLDELGLWESAAPLPGPVRQRFGELVADAARPIDDVRGTAAYRRHALSVLARRTLGWAWESFRGEVAGCG